MVLAIRVSAWNSLTATQRTIVRHVLARLEVGQPATYVAPGAVLWLIFEDDRISLRDIAVLGVVAARLAEAGALNLPEGAPAIKAAVLNYVAAHLIEPATLNLGANPAQEVLTAQGAPASVRAGDSVPAGWVAG